jgi:hypothetical protein
MKVIHRPTSYSKYLFRFEPNLDPVDAAVLHLRIFDRWAFSLFEIKVSFARSLILILASLHRERNESFRRRSFSEKMQRQTHAPYRRPPVCLEVRSVIHTEL